MTQLLENTSTVLFLEKFRKKIGIHTSGKYNKLQFLSRIEIETCKCDNFVFVVVPVSSNDEHVTNSAKDPAEKTNELTLDDQEITRASRSQLQDLIQELQYFFNLVEPTCVSGAFARFFLTRSLLANAHDVRFGDELHHDRKLRVVPAICRRTTHQ